jgi:hypothetical protein
MRYGRLAACVLAALIVDVGADGDGAWAQFGDCAAPGYLGPVDDRMGGVAFDCDEAERFTIDTPRGPRQVRIIQDAGRAAEVAGAVADIHRVVEQAAAAQRSIGQGAPKHMTFWASRLPRPVVADGDVGGQTNPLADACLIAIFPGGNIANTTAHEFFHCVQYAEAPGKVDLAASTWWVEGSAEWFAELALADATASDDYVAMFDETSPDVALTSMDYQSIVFFFWLSQHFGPSMVMALMDAAPSGGGEAAQQRALAGMFSEDDFQDFAQTYLDRGIRRSGGRVIPSTPFPGDIYVFADSREHRIAADPFVLARAQFEFACGLWSIARREETGTWAVSRDDRPWSEMPPTVTVAGGAPALFRVAGFGVGPRGFSTTIEATRNPCHDCAAAARLDDVADACLVGRWQLVSGGYGALVEDSLRETGIFETLEYPDLERILVIGRDGAYSISPSPDDIVMTTRSDDGDLWSSFGTLAYETSGQWSTDGDVLQLCESDALADIDLTIVDPEGAAERFQISGGPSGFPPLLRERTFACSASNLTLVEDVPFSPTVTWEYRRVE